MANIDEDSKYQSSRYRKKILLRNRFVSLTLFNENSALYSSFLYKFNKSLYLQFYYQIEVTFNDKSFKLYPFHVRERQSQDELELFKWRISEIDLEFLIQHNWSGFQIYQTTFNNNQMKRKGIWNMKTVVNNSLFVSDILIFVRLILIPMIEYNKKLYDDFDNSSKSLNWTIQS